MAPRRPAQTRPASTTQARAYLSKAREFLRASTDSLELGNTTAASGNAAHAGIGAAAAIAAARAGAVWRGEHSKAPSYLEKAAGADGRQAARHLRRLLPLKSQAEDDPDPVPYAEAAGAVEAARRIVAIAKQVIGSISLDE